MHPLSQPPASTYRVQLSFSFTLDDLAAQVPYLDELGVTDIYLSPIYTARPESPHGYDIVDHAAIDPQIGGEAGWQRLTAAVRARGLGVVLDVVPNHMAADPVHNHLWRQMLREGPASAAARHFDVDWRPLTGLIRDKVLLPALEEPYSAALMQGQVRLEHADGEFRVRCGAFHLPLAPGSVEAILEAWRLTGDARSAAERDLVTARAIQETSADPRRLHAVLEAQHYRLAYWRAANDEINYRRFFDVNELVAIRTEEQDVFQRSHRLILQLAHDDVVHGLRIDHVDGLLEPATYLQRLRTAADDAAGRRMWIVAEKILARSEVLEPTWPVQGTTGYDALNVLNRLFISGRGLRTMRHFYQRLVEIPASYRKVAYDGKRQVMETTLRSSLTMLSHELKRVADASWMTRDITLNAVSAALVEFIAGLSIYRTYFGEGSEREGDRAAVEQAFTRAILRNPTTDPSALRFLRSLLLDPSDDPALAAARQRVVKHLQQYTSAVHAKGIEDTAFYRDNTLLALNDVGGDPGGISGTLDEFHRFNERRARLWPHALTATSTHDTKLGEDTRIRIASLTGFSREWTSAVRAWRALNGPLRHLDPRGASIDVNDEYRLYQVLIGLWPGHDSGGVAPADPSLVERVVEFMRKSVREAQVHTSWMHANEPYEAAVETFVRGVMTDSGAGEFRRSLRAMVQLVLPLGLCHSLSQLVLKCLMPGVPDVYQGDESWALCVTDPDNRRPIDFRERFARLQQLQQETAIPPQLPPASPGESSASAVKHYVTAQLLRFRRDHRRLMALGKYASMRARGARGSSLIAFRRTLAREHLVVAVPRLVERSAAAGGWPTECAFWNDTELRIPSQVGEWTNLLSGRQVAADRSSPSHLWDLTGRWPWLVLYGHE